MFGNSAPSLIFISPVLALSPKRPPFAWAALHLAVLAASLTRTNST